MTFPLTGTLGVFLSLCGGAGGSGTAGERAETGTAWIRALSAVCQGRRGRRGVNTIARYEMMAFAHTPIRPYLRHTFIVQQTWSWSSGVTYMILVTIVQRYYFIVMHHQRMPHHTNDNLPDNMQQAQEHSTCEYHQSCKMDAEHVKL